MRIKIFLIALVLFIATSSIWAQEIPTIQLQEIERIERMLSSDDMQGRKTFTPGIDKAAAFIADEFKKAGLQPWNESYLQQFIMIRPKFISAKATLDGSEIETKNIIALTTNPFISVNEKSGYEVIKITATDTLINKIVPLINGKINAVIFVDPLQQRAFNNLKRYKRETFPTEQNLVFVLTDKIPSVFNIEVQHQITELKLANVVGVIPGKSRKDEYVIFSGHYDHLGIAKPNAEMDSVYNGANDDAAGTTAVIALANYFSKLKNNERTLVFAAFTAEEIGGFGSQYFSKQFNPEKVAAMFNIEMIGTESKWGTNSAYITGYEMTNMGQILQKNLKGSPFRFYPDPYPQQQLFYRSDNATLARLGVPAHTISTAKMDAEKYYHTPDDEIETLNLDNMAKIIKAIATSASSIVSGKDTPSRVDTKQLR